MRLYRVRVESRDTSGKSDRVDFHSGFQSRGAAAKFAAGLAASGKAGFSSSVEGYEEEGDGDGALFSIVREGDPAVWLSRAPDAATARDLFLRREMDRTRDSNEEEAYIHPDPRSWSLSGRDLDVREVKDLGPFGLTEIARTTPLRCGATRFDLSSMTIEQVADFLGAAVVDDHTIRLPGPPRTGSSGSVGAIGRLADALVAQCRQDSEDPGEEARQALTEALMRADC